MDTPNLNIKRLNTIVPGRGKMFELKWEYFKYEQTIQNVKRYHLKIKEQPFNGKYLKMIENEINI